MGDLLWFLGWLLVAWWCLRAARDYGDEPQPSQRDDWAAAWEHRYALPAYDPNHHAKGD